MVDRRFTLAGLLRLRKVQEDQARASSVLADRRRRRTETEMVVMRDELGEQTVLIDDPSQLTAVAAGRAAMSSMLGDLTELLAEQKASADAARESYIAAHRATKSIEKLAEKHEKALRAEDLRREQADLDEFSIQRGPQLGSGSGFGSHLGLAPQPAPGEETR